jgi:adenylate cyclase
MRRVRDADRRPDTYIKRMFTVTRAPGDEKVLLIGLDSEGKVAAFAHPGEVYRTTTGHTIDFEKPVVDQAYSADAFGRFLRASAPVRNSAGEVVAALVVEGEEEIIRASMRPVVVAGLVALGLGLGLVFPASVILSRRVSRPLTRLRNAVEAIGHGDFTPRLAIESSDEFGEVERAVNSMAEGLGERDRVKNAFARYVPHQVMETVLSSKAAGPQLNADRRRVTVLFSDIRSFSSMSERMPPERVVAILNEYFEAMVEVVFHNHGTLDKFLGDGLMVIFGAPADDPYQEEHALRTAIEMQQELTKLRGKWEGEGMRINIGIGINSGPAVVGNIGSNRRMDYTAIGDTVNLASRLESATKDLKVEILISEYTYHGVSGAFKLRPMGPVQVRGRSEAVQTYTLAETTS